MSAIDKFIREVKCYNQQWYAEIGGPAAEQELAALRAGASPLTQSHELVRMLLAHIKTMSFQTRQANIDWNSLLDLLEKANNLCVPIANALRADSVTTAQESSPGSGALTFDVLQKAMEQVKLAPRAQQVSAIWFVDRTEASRKIVETSLATKPPPFGLGFLGTNVRSFKSTSVSPEKDIIAAPNEDLAALRAANPGKVVWPHWCATPGVWIEMRDGSVLSANDYWQLNPND